MLDLVQRIRSLARPLAPLPTGVAPRLAPLPGIRAVLFDLYGTLFVYRQDGARRSIDTRAPETGVRTLEPVAMAERTWFRYRGYILLSLWVLVAALLAKIALGNKRKVS